MPKTDLSDRLKDALAQVANAQAYRTAAGEAQQAAEKAKLPMPYADQASLAAGHADAVYMEANKIQDALAAAGQDPAMANGLIQLGDQMLQDAKDRLSQAASVH